MLKAPAIMCLLFPSGYRKLPTICLRLNQLRLSTHDRFWQDSSPWRLHHHTQSNLGRGEPWGWLSLRAWQPHQPVGNHLMMLPLSFLSLSPSPTSKLLCSPGTHLLNIVNFRYLQNSTAASQSTPSLPPSLIHRKSDNSTHPLLLATYLPVFTLWQNLSLFKGNYVHIY